MRRINAKSKKPRQISLSYSLPARLDRRMKHERDRAMAIEYYLLSALVGGSLVYGLACGVFELFRG
jgi:hypothetical protein